jgi:hypothetical protein
VLLACYRNVPPERAAAVTGMLLGVPVSAGWVDKAAARVSAQLGKAGFDDAMIAALAADLGRDAGPPPAARDEQEDKDPEEKAEKTASGAPHVLIVRTPDGRLTWLQAVASRRKAAGRHPALLQGVLVGNGASSLKVARDGLVPSAQWRHQAARAAYLAKITSAAQTMKTFGRYRDIRCLSCKVFLSVCRGGNPVAVRIPSAEARIGPQGSRLRDRWNPDRAYAYWMIEAGNPLPCSRLLRTGFAGELPIVNAADESIPLCGGKVQDGPSRVLAVANPDPVTGQACDLYAVTVVRA